MYGCINRVFQSNFMNFHLQELNCLLNFKLIDALSFSFIVASLESFDLLKCLYCAKFFPPFTVKNAYLFLI